MDVLYNSEIGQQQRTLRTPIDRESDLKVLVTLKSLERRRDDRTIHPIALQQAQGSRSFVEIPVRLGRNSHTGVDHEKSASLLRLQTAHVMEASLIKIQATMHAG